MRVFCIVLALLGLATAAAPSTAQFVNDNNVLNYALTLENFEATLYGQVNRFTQDQFTAAGYPTNTRAAIVYIGNVEQQHATFLTGFLGTRGWPAVPVCQNYNFSSIVTVKDLVDTLAVVEAVGTSAYDGAAQGITEKNILEVAAGIATIEGRHTSLLNTVAYNTTTGAFTPFLNSNDGSTPFNFTYVQSLIAPFFVGATCPTQTNITAYNGTVSVSSTTPSSYQWVSANSLRGQSSDLLTFYKSNTQAGPNDLAVLNYALTLENLEATFYAAFAELYSVANIQAAGFDLATATVINANIATIGEHEKTHVTFLNATIYGLGGVGATPCNYNISQLNLTSTSTFAQFLAVAANLENTGVTAYVGAIQYFVNSDVTSIAAAIATVEAEHAAYIANLLNNVGQSSQFNPNPSVGSPVTGTTPNSQTSVDVAFGTVDGGSAPTAVVNSIITLLNCTTSQFGSPVPITATQFLNYFSDQDAFNTNPGSTTTSTTISGTTSTTTTTTNNNPTSNPATTTVTDTRNTGSAAAVVASAAVVVFAMLF